ncbi:MAG: hypothetical protein ACREP7_22675 [Lysobacter sp.]
MIRHWLVPAALVALFALSSAPAQARSLGTVTHLPTTGLDPSTGPWGGYDVYTVNLRRWNSSTGQWDFHLLIAGTYQDCINQYGGFVQAGWLPNPNPGTGVCQKHGGYVGMAIASPYGNGPTTSVNWSKEAVLHYDEGVRALREKYRIEAFAREHDLLVKTIEAMPGSVVEDGEGK